MRFPLLSFDDRSHMTVSNIPSLLNPLEEAKNPLLAVNKRKRIIRDSSTLRCDCGD